MMRTAVNIVMMISCDMTQQNIKPHQVFTSFLNQVPGLRRQMEQGIENAQVNITIAIAIMASSSIT